MTIRLFLLFLTVAMFLSAPANAHEIRPAALELIEEPGGTVAVNWKQPITSGRRLKMQPILPSQCKMPERTNQIISGSAITETWRVKCKLNAGKISVEGLDQTLTDVFVRIKFAGGAERTHILRPASASFSLDQAASSPAREYLRIGVDHMLSGWDHLLFVLGLLLIAPLRKLLWVITAFTLGHSVTLGIVALGLFSLPSGPVELLIALSIFFLGVEALRKRAGRTSLTIRKPWIVACVFGLLHGLGFAGALADIGLPKGEEIWALLLFNLGVEIGQIIFIVGALSVFWLVGKIALDKKAWLEVPAVYLVGSLGAYYSLIRLFA